MDNVETCEHDSLKETLGMLTKLSYRDMMTLCNSLSGYLHANTGIEISPDKIANALLNSCDVILWKKTTP